MTKSHAVCCSRFKLGFGWIVQASNQNIISYPCSLSVSSLRSLYIHYVRSSKFKLEWKVSGSVSIARGDRLSGQQCFHCFLTAQSARRLELPNLLNFELRSVCTMTATMIPLHLRSSFSYKNSIVFEFSNENKSYKIIWELVSIPSILTNEQQIN